MAYAALSSSTPKPVRLPVTGLRNTYGEQEHLSVASSPPKSQSRANNFGHTEGNNKRTLLKQPSSRFVNWALESTQRCLGFPEASLRVTELTSCHRVIF